MKVKILGHSYNVFFDSDRTDRNEYGNCISSELRISIDNNTPKSWQNETLIHEIAEAINAHLDLKLEHSTINRVGSIIHQITESNPELLKFLANIKKK